MTTQLATREDVGDQLEQLLISGNLGALNASQRVMYYRQVCQSLGLNFLTKPFDYITLNGKLTLYARKDATDQLRKMHGVSITKLERDVSEGVYVVTAYARDAQGREDSSVGAVAIEGLKGEARANAMMKAETKAKRRVTLSLCGLGFLDETETTSIPDARTINVDMATGEILEGQVVETPPAPLSRTALEARWNVAVDKANALGIPPKVTTLSPKATLTQIAEWCDRLEANIREAEAAQQAA